jgi:hypothetical protein
MISMAAFVLGLILYAYTDPSLRDEVVAQAHMANLCCFLYGVALVVCYRIANIPLKLLLKPLHFCHVPESMVTDTQEYYARFSRAEASENQAPLETM